MIRLVNKATGVVVEVDEATAATLGNAYEPTKAATKSTPAKK